MVASRWIGLFCSLLIFGSLAIGADLATPPDQIEIAELDKSGIAWGIRRGSSQIYRFDGVRWDSVRPLESPSESVDAIALARMPDGGVACLWRIGKTGSAITRHFGNEARLLAKLPVPFRYHEKDVTLFADSKSQLWITNSTPEIHRISPNHDAPWIYWSYRFPDDAFRGGSRRRPGYNPLMTMEDGKGRIWVWANRLMGAPNFTSLGGIAIIDGDKVTIHPQLDGAPQTSFTMLSKRDEKRVWLPILGEGIFSIDINSLEAIRESDEEGLRRPHGLIPDGVDWLAVADDSDGGYTTSLWRLHEGKWSRVIERWQSIRGNALPLARQQLDLKDGKLLAAAGGAPWYLPKEGKPQRLDWRSGFAPQSVGAILPMKDEKLLMPGNAGALFYDRLPLPNAVTPSPRVEEVDTEVDWETDANSHLWAVSPTKQTLEQWDGNSWKSFPLPPDFHPQLLEDIAAEAKGLIWLFFNSPKQPLAVFNPADEKWAVPSSLRAAYEERRSDPPQWVNRRLHPVTAVYSDDATRIAYVERKVIHYYDGQKWRSWRQHDILVGRSTLGAPFFGRDDVLTVNLDKDQSQYIRDSWLQNKPTPEELEKYGPKDRYTQIPRPDSSPVREPISIAIDNLGTYWLLSREEGLIKFRDKRSVRIFADKTGNPFITPLRLDRVWTDRTGHTFVKATATETDTRTYRIAPKAPSPRTELTVEKTGPDSIHIKLDPRTKAPVTFQWQLDDRPAQSTTETTLAFYSLPNGKHRITVTATDDELQSDGIPATAEFETRIDPEAQLTAILQRLHDPDYAQRHGAIAALVLLPERAVPALKAAREKATDDDRFWIDAALQEIEREQKRKASAPLTID